jgi:hypothetical protein
MAVKLQKKISVAKVFGKINAAIIAKAGGTSIHVMRVLGSASGVKTGVSDFGEWSALTGQFRAMNPETGETTDAAQLFMPDVAQEMVIAQLTGGAVAVDFAFDLFAELDETSSVGYTYRATPLLNEGESPIIRIESKLLALAPPQDEAPQTKGRGKAKS